MIILSNKQMAQCDRDTIAKGTMSTVLMQRAGMAVAREIMQRFPKQNTLLICGPGNNGGDGFIVANILKEHDWNVVVALYGSKDTLKNDAKYAAEKWTEDVLPITFSLLANDKYSLVIDALFGTGLSTVIPETIAQIFTYLNSSKKHTVVAIDIPSGINGDNGSIMGKALKAKLTITFAFPKIGHFLYPGREYTGELVVADIGIKLSIPTNLSLNSPVLWDIPALTHHHHKYSRGYALIYGSNTTFSGAALLAAEAAVRIGAGIVRIICEKTLLPIYAGYLRSLLFSSYDAVLDFSRVSSILIGPGTGMTAITREHVLATLARKKSCVLDADALRVFTDNPEELFKAIKKCAKVIITPHLGEFTALFPSCSYDKLTNVRLAAKSSGAVVVLKGADTVIASPNGCAAINNNALPSLATAGSGDVLAGIITGLLARGMSAFFAACAGVYVHGKCAIDLYGVIAEDLVKNIPSVLNSLYTDHNKQNNSEL